MHGLQAELACIGPLSVSQLIAVVRCLLRMLCWCNLKWNAYAIVKGCALIEQAFSLTTWYTQTAGWLLNGFVMHGSVQLGNAQDAIYAHFLDQVLLIG